MRKDQVMLIGCASKALQTKDVGLAWHFSAWRRQQQQASDFAVHTGNEQPLPPPPPHPAPSPRSSAVM